MDLAQPSWPGGAGYTDGIDPSARVVEVPVGLHAFDLQVTDEDGARHHDTVVVRVLSGEPNDRPIAKAGPDQRLTDQAHDGVETILLDGSQSRDLDGVITYYRWFNQAGDLIATGPNPDIELGYGEHQILLEVEDDRRQTGTDAVKITVDRHPGTPVIIAPKAISVTLAAGQTATRPLVIGNDGNSKDLAWRLLPDIIDTSDLRPVCRLPSNTTWVSAMMVRASGLPINRMSSKLITTVRCSRNAKWSAFAM